jgi:hypothetical protein
LWWVRRGDSRFFGTSTFDIFRRLYGKLCAAPTGLESPRIHCPTTSVVGYVVSSLAGLEGKEKPDRHGFFVRGWKWKKNPHPSQKT